MQNKGFFLSLACLLLVALTSTNSSGKRLLPAATSETATDSAEIASRESNRAPSGAADEIDIRQLNGIWEGGRALRFNRTEDYRLIIEKNLAWLQILGEQNSLIPLSPARREKEGLLFRLPDRNNHYLEFDAIRLMLADPSNSQSINWLILHFLLQNKPIGSGIMMVRPEIPVSHSFRVFREKSSAPTFLYQDWQGRRMGSPSTADETEARNRLKQTLTKLRETGGWRCLAQVTRSVRDTRKIKIISGEQGINRLYLLYSPFANRQLAYGLASTPPAYAIVEGQTYDYPIFQSVHRTYFQSNTEIVFSLLPSLTTPLGKREVTITVFILGRSPGDYGTGCDE